MASVLHNVGGALIVYERPFDDARRLNANGLLAA